VGASALAPAGLSTAAGAEGASTASQRGFYQDQVPYTCSDSERNYAEVSEPGPYDMETAVEYVVELDSDQDGETVQIGVVRPDPEAVDDAPVIVRATPYVEDLRDTNIAECWGVKRLAYNFVPHGYAIGVIPVRGTGGSGGCMTLFGPAERRDLDQAVDHLGEAEWSNGNVGMSGGSYDGTTPFEVAAMGNDHLETIVPMSGVPNVHELMYRNGAPEIRGPLILNALYYAISLGTDGPATGTRVDTYATRAACSEYAQGGFASTYAGVTGEKDPSGYWAARNLKPLVEANYDGSIFYVQGLQDWNVDASQMYPWTETLEEVDDIEMRYMLGQFSHAYPDDGDWAEGTRRNDWADIALRWYDRELKGKDVEVGPDAYVQDSTGGWRAEDTWPPERAETGTWRLQPGGGLSREPTDETGSATVAVDPDRHGALFYPGDVPGCEACARFETEPFAEEYRFAGQPDLNLTVTPTGPGGYLTAYLLAVDAEGDGERIGWGMLDLRYPDRGDSAQPVVPGETLEISLPVEPLDARIPAGSRLAVVLHQGTMSGRVGLTPYPVQVDLGDGAAGLAVRTFEASPDAAAAPDPVEPVPDVDVAGERADDGSLFTGGQTNRVDVTVEPADDVTVRDPIPSAWDVVGGEGDPREVGDTTYVEFGTAPAGETTTFTYFAEAPTGPTASGEYAFGPLEASADDGDNWETVPGTDDTNYVVGAETTMLGTR
jgi:putative CocE/NonD family hydrolase